MPRELALDLREFLEQVSTGQAVAEPLASIAAWLAGPELAEGQIVVSSESLAAMSPPLEQVASTAVLQVA